MTLFICLLAEEPKVSVEIIRIKKKDDADDKDNSLAVEDIKEIQQIQVFTSIHFYYPSSELWQKGIVVIMSSVRPLFSENVIS